MRAPTQKLIETWKEDEVTPFAGWDFSHLDGRWHSEELPWDYADIVRSHLRPDMMLLDMGTGGGEFLLTLNHPYPNTTVTEGYPPNYELCLQQLAPLGITVRSVVDDKLDFPDQSFDIVLNRHESYLASELKRVLKPGGMFITQQVGGRNNSVLSRRLIPGYAPELPDHDLAHNMQAFTREGFEIQRAEEAIQLLKFYDTGALVYFARNIPWEFPGFSVDTHLPQLLEVEDEIASRGFVSSDEHRFLLVTRRP